MQYFIFYLQLKGINPEMETPFQAAHLLIISAILIYLYIYEFNTCVRTFDSQRDGVHS